MSRSDLVPLIVLAGFPLVVIAIVAGTVGYLLQDEAPPPIPALPAQEERASGVQGTIETFADDQLTVVTTDGSTLTFEVPGESAIEQLIPIGRDELTVGDWINGGAIPHPDTILALVGLVLVSDPVIQAP